MTGAGVLLGHVLTENGLGLSFLICKIRKRGIIIICLLCWVFVRIKGERLAHSKRANLNVHSLRIQGRSRGEREQTQILDVFFSRYYTVVYSSCV